MRSQVGKPRLLVYGPLVYGPLVYGPLVYGPLVLCLAMLFWQSVGGGVVRAEDGAPRRSEAHQEYTRQMWEKLAGYTNWPRAGQPFDVDFGPRPDRVRCYLANTNDLPARQMKHGAVVVCEHLDGEDQVRGVTAFFRADPGKGYERSGDWYWAHFTPDGKVVKTIADRSAFDRRDFLADVKDGRLWVFHVNSPEVAEYVTTGEPPEKHTTRIGGGPQGMTVRGPDGETISRYLAMRSGFETVLDADGRLWVFRAGSPEWQAFRQAGELEKLVIRPGVGPGGKTVKAPDAETIDAYLSAE